MHFKKDKVGMLKDEILHYECENKMNEVGLESKINKIKMLKGECKTKKRAQRIMKRNGCI